MFYVVSSVVAGYIFNTYFYRNSQIYIKNN